MRPPLRWFERVEASWCASLAIFACVRGLHSRISRIADTRARWAAVMSLDSSFHFFDSGVTHDFRSSDASVMSTQFCRTRSLFRVRGCFPSPLETLQNLA